ncbi:MAG: transcription-repair coupling factor (superfamily II helicase) [Candidatus Peregrinibacteria bacterium Greene0416_62]|nr:MAG: transcription-repair coupling factor (superfamily II helicase) [Candidatus Peregrinibacteria bacterium Greene0416_62]TSC98982.1 MAG: transcription-repair coupling factor (superfamily II helicase) [Candidatus Peregrinibacteria bacterium Greene1014_49]
MDPLLFLGEKTHRDLADALAIGHTLTLSGASNETAKALLLGTILRHRPRPTFLVTEDENHVDALQHWLQFFGVPSRALHPTENEAGQIVPDALRAYLLSMQGKDVPCTIVSRSVWDQKFPLFAAFADGILPLKNGKEIVFTTLIESLIAMGYIHGDDNFLVPGQYRRVGDVFDVWPIQELHPHRITLEFDRVESIAETDPHDPGKVLEMKDSVDICPIVYEHMQPLSEQIPHSHFLVIDDQDEIIPPEGVDILRFTAFPEGATTHVHLRYLSVMKFYTLTDFLNDIRDKLQQDWALFVVTKRTDELKGICTEEHVPFTHGLERRPGAITIVSAGKDDLLPHSLQNPDLRIALLTDREIFSLRKAGRERSVQKLALDFITSLVPGDYVVHMEHGIGHFEGMTQKEVDGTDREYLELTYAEGDKLFIPVDQADKLSKYVYEEGNEPILTRLGTNDWQKIQSKLKEETQKIALELLKIYALRAKARGHSFGGDTEMMKKFEVEFPYQETPGQMKAIEDIKKDMESGHPMDRLICGDVGFGKTEVAMRAAFKAVQGGKQVAVLAPITILVQQHYESFRKRMEGFGVRIDILSRFRSPAQQRVTIEKARKGDVDIVIGTHRLLQEDVKFLNLGLLVIDEEQRFGVKQKEKFKEMRASIDILTLTATPIPRTLNLGLHKLRDITTITTPPPGRLPIITEVRKYSDILIREAITTEIKRSGQVYFLHNRVETIDAFADKLRLLCPKARFVVGHGQLRPEVLEERILAFKNGEFDVLVSSTIIENGIDLPRANTLIVNSAEHFGLAQLYQLRGRVGRSKLQAYAYFLYHGQKLHEDAKKRLRAIVEACELGSGFQVAMRDLEIRGAGEILGAEQSGTMQTVGVSHYLRMLKSAVEELQSGGTGEVEDEVAAEILLPVAALLPPFYIPDEGERISVYQKLAGSENDAILKEFQQDLLEEYGHPPPQVENLFHVLKLKLACRRSGVHRIKMEVVSARDREEIVLTLAKRVTAKEIMQLLKLHPQWRISGAQLRIHFEELKKGAGGKDAQWLKALTEQVGLLQREGKKG